MPKVIMISFVLWHNIHLLNSFFFFYFNIMIIHEVNGEVQVYRHKKFVSYLYTPINSLYKAGNNASSCKFFCFVQVGEFESNQKACRYQCPEDREPVCFKGVPLFYTLRAYTY